MSASTFATETARLQAFCGDTSATTLTYIQQMTNEAYQELADAYDWSWLLTRGVLNLQGTYSAGTLSAAAAATALTGSSTLSTTVTNTNLEIEVATEVFAGTPGADTTFTLSGSRTAVPVAIAAGTAYTMFRRRYALQARMRGTPVFRVTASGTRLPLKFVTLEEFDIECQPPFLYTTPQIVTFAGLDSSGNSEIEVYPIPAVAAGLYYRGYRQVVDLTGSTAFDFPVEILPVFRYLALAKLWHWRKDSEREVIARQEYAAALERAMNADSQDDGRGDQMIPDPQRFAKFNYRDDVNRVFLGNWDS